MPYVAKMTQEQRRQRREEIKRRLLVGENPKELAVEYGVTDKFIWGLRPGIRNKLCGQFSTYALIAELCNTDKTIRVLAKEYGLSFQRVQQVYARCCKVGIPVQERKRGTRGKDRP